jgi:hypothetical protein
MDIYKILKTLDSINEAGAGEMKAAEKHPSGSKFGGYWMGTQKSPPKPGQGAGGCGESAVEANYVQGAGPDDSQSTIHGDNIKKRLQQEWNKFVSEYGANPPGGTARSNSGTEGSGGADFYNPFSGAYKGANQEKTSDFGQQKDDMDDDQQVNEYGADNGSIGATQNPTSAANTAKQVQNTQQNLRKLQSAGTDLTAGTSTAAKDVSAVVDDPKLRKPGNQDQQTRNITGALGNQLGDVAAKANPSQMTQLSNIIKQINTGTN